MSKCEKWVSELGSPITQTTEECDEVDRFMLVYKITPQAMSKFLEVLTHHTTPSSVKACPVPSC